MMPPLLLPPPPFSVLQCVIVIVWWSVVPICSLRSGPSLLVSPGVHDVAVVSLTPGPVQLIHLVVHVVRLPDRAGITPVLLVTAASCEGQQMKMINNGFLAVHLLFHISRWSALLLVIRTKQNWLPYSSLHCTDGTLSSLKSSSQAGLGSLILSLVQDLHFWTCV